MSVHLATLTLSPAFPSTDFEIIYQIKSICLNGGQSGIRPDVAFQNVFEQPTVIVVGLALEGLLTLDRSFALS